MGEDWISLYEEEEEEVLQKSIVLLNDLHIALLPYTFLCSKLIVF